MDEDLDFEYDVEEHVLGLMHAVASIEVPTWYRNPNFKILFADENRCNLESLSDACQLEFADTLPPVLNSDKPPPFSFFKGLPKPTGERWAIYVVAMEQAG